jgi:hypothetical protein
MKGGLYQPLIKSYLNLSASRCFHIYNLLWSDAKEGFWNLLHESYVELLGWTERVAEDFENPEVCDFAANVAMYEFDQYKKRLSKGRKLKKEKIDVKLKQSFRRKRLRAFVAKFSVKKKKANG